MRVWLASCILLFVLAQLFQWIKQLSLPLPVFILGGALLAIASNYDKRSGWPFDKKTSQLKPDQIEVPTAIDFTTDIPESQPVATIWRPEEEQESPIWRERLTDYTPTNPKNVASANKQ